MKTKKGLTSDQSDSIMSISMDYIDSDPAFGVNHVGGDDKIETCGALRKHSYKLNGSVTSLMSKIQRMSHQLSIEKINHAEDKPETTGLELNGAILPRLVSKNGNCRIQMKNVPYKKSLVSDIFTTAVEMSWRYTLLAFVSSFFVTWVLFAGIWFLIAFSHGDFDESNKGSGNFTPCVHDLHNFASCFLFSVETQHTIGYGTRSTSEECPQAIIMMCLQSIIGVLSSSCMAGIVFAKLARPSKRSHTVAFSKTAVIRLIDGHLYLLFRVGNMRRSHIIEAHLRAILVHHQKRNGKEAFQLGLDEIKVSVWLDREEDKCLMLLPITVSHKIDYESPFYNLTPEKLAESNFELVVILEGVAEPTGNPLQARTSYTPNEILWGHNFNSMVSYDQKGKSYFVDCSSISATSQDEATPNLSMKQIEEEQNK